jgi:hypothetical protein
MGAFDDHLFGNPTAAVPTLAEHDLRRITRRAQRRADRGMQPPGFYRARAAEQAELARQINEALRMRDAVSVRNPIEEAARLGYSHTAMLRAVEEQTQQERLEEMDAVRSQRREADPWSDDRELYDEEWLDDEPR